MSRIGSVVVVSAMLMSGVCAAQAAGWAAHWQLNEKSGSAARDLSPNANHGTLKNFGSATWVAGKFANALQFDGVDDYVEIGIKKALPVFDGGGSPYSIAMWVKGPAQEDKRCYAEGNNRSNSPLFTIGTGRNSLQTGDRLHVFIRNDRSRNVLNHSSNATVFDDKWHHIAWVDVGGRGTLYVDGVKDSRNFDYTKANAVAGRGTQTAGFGTHTMNVAALGAVLRQSACCHFKGALDDVRVYRFALTPADIGILIRSAAPNYPPCRQSIGKFGFGCGTGPFDITATGSAGLGQTIRVALSNGPASRPAVLLIAPGPAAPLALEPILGWKGCQLYTPLSFVLPLGVGVLDAKGATKSLAFPVPQSRALSCGLLLMQGLAFATAHPETSGVIIAQFGQ